MVNKTEILSRIQPLLECGNIIIKYGRYVPGGDPHYDDVLGVELASANQYAEAYE